MEDKSTECETECEFIKKKGTKVWMVTAEKAYIFEREVNAGLKVLSEAEKEVVDIKYLVSDGVFSAMIIFKL